MDRGMKSMSSNLVWSLVEVPREVKPIRSKLIYKIKSHGKPYVDVDVQEWKRAMDPEMESMVSNLVWSLIKAPRGVIPIGSKLIDKKKSLGKLCVHKRFKVQ